MHSAAAMVCDEEIIFTESTTDNADAAAPRASSRRLLGIAAREPLLGDTRSDALDMLFCTLLGGAIGAEEHLRGCPALEGALVMLLSESDSAGRLGSLACRFGSVVIKLTLLGEAVGSAVMGVHRERLWSTTTRLHGAPLCPCVTDTAAVVSSKVMDVSISWG